MARKVRISRQGLTSCPSCTAHIRVDADDVAATACPFCGASLREGGVLSSIRQAVAHSRSGLVAASLLGLTTLAGCGSDDEPVEDMTQDGGTDTTTDTGVDGGMDVMDSMEPEVQPLYGQPADITPDETIDVQDDAPPAPLYGTVPDMG